MRETPSWRVLCFFRCASRSGASLGPRPPRRATRRQGNADLWSAQPAAGGRQRRTPSCPAGMERWCGHVGKVGVISAGFALPRVPAPTGRTGQRSAFPCGRHHLAGRGSRAEHFRSNWPALRCRVPSARVACAGFAGVRPAVRVSALRHHAERRAGKGTPTSGRHSPPQAGGREGPRVGLWFASRQGPASSAQVSRSRACRPEVGVPLPAASTAGLEAPTGRPGGVPSSAAS